MAVRIPRSVAQDARIDEGAELDMSVVKGKVVMTPSAGPRYSLKDLLSGVTRANLHAEVGTGTPVGREVW